MKILTFCVVCLLLMHWSRDLRPDDTREKELANMKQAAIKALSDCDMCAITNEATVILRSVREGNGVIRDADVHYESIGRLERTLDPIYLGSTRISKGTPDLPMHIAVRFGDHHLYAYVWLFGSDHEPFEMPDGVELIEDGVYFSSVNE